MSIHSGDPFATPDAARSAVRRLRGRLPAAVTLWTAVTAEGRPAGLTVSSTLVAEGEPGRLLGLLDAESALCEALRETRRFVVCPLRTSDRLLADIFAGLLPAPGGPFAAASWTATEYGPVLAGAGTWAGGRVDDLGEFGWAVLVTATLETVELGELEAPLVHYRGRYAAGPSSAPERIG